MLTQAILKKGTKGPELVAPKDCRTKRPSLRKRPLLALLTATQTACKAGLTRSPPIKGQQPLSNVFPTCLSITFQNSHGLKSPAPTVALKNSRSHGSPRSNHPLCAPPSVQVISQPHAAMGVPCRAPSRREDRRRDQRHHSRSHHISRPDAAVRLRRPVPQPG